MGKIKRILLIIPLFILVLFSQKLEAKADDVEWKDSTFTFKTHTQVMDYTHARWKPTHWVVSGTIGGKYYSAKIPIDDWEEELEISSVTKYVYNGIYSYDISSTWIYTISQEKLAGYFGLKYKDLQETGLVLYFNAITAKYWTDTSNDITGDYSGQTMYDKAKESQEAANYVSSYIQQNMGKTDWYTYLSSSGTWVEAESKDPYSWRAPNINEYWDREVTKEYVNEKEDYTLTINPNGGTYINSSGTKSTSTLTQKISSSHSYYAVSSTSTTAGLTSPATDTGIRAGYYISKPTKTGYNFAGWLDQNPMEYGGITYQWYTFDAPYYSNLYSDIKNAYGYDKEALLAHYHNSTTIGTE